MAPTNPTLLHFVSQLVKRTHLPYWTDVCLHFISSFQILYLILEQTFNTDLGIDLKVIKYVREASSYVTGFNIYDPPEEQHLMEVVWYLLCAYIVLFVVLTASFVYQCHNGKHKLWPRLSSSLGFLFKIHSRIMFCPIHHFFIWIISLHNECSTLVETEDSDWHCKSYYFGVTIVLCVISFGFALFQEVALFSIRKDKDALSSKSNFYFQTQFLHKAVIPIFLMMLTDTQAIAFVFNLVFALGIGYNLVRNFPFFDTLVQKLSFFYAAANFSSALFVFAFSFKKGQQYFEVTTIILCILLYRVLAAYFEMALKRIFDLRFRTPQEALHISVLLKKHTKKYSSISLLDSNYKEGSFYLYGFLKSYKINPENLAQFSTFKDYELELYTLVLNKLNDLRRKYPKNDLLLLLIIEIYVKKIGNASRAITLLNHIQDSRSSIQIQLAVRDLYHKLEKKYCNVDSNTELEVLRYFQFRDHVNQLKDNITHEINKQIKVWREMATDTMNVKSVADISEEIDKLHKSSKRMWFTHSKSWETSFASPFLMYGVYLDVVRKNQFDGLKCIEKFYDMRKEKVHLKKTMNAFSEDVAILLASIEAEKPGVIVDASSSVQSIFKITKDMLVGQRTDALLPRFVAKKHEGMIKKYSQNSRHDLNQQWNTYARTIDGSIFQADVRLKVYPYINRGLNLISQVRRIQNPEIIMVVDSQGAIVDCSEELFPVLNLSKRDLDTAKIQEICPGFRVIDHAMHFLFDGGKDLIMTHFPSMNDPKPRSNGHKLSGFFKQEDFDSPGSSDDEEENEERGGMKIDSTQDRPTTLAKTIAEKMAKDYNMNKGGSATVNTNTTMDAKIKQHESKNSLMPGKTLLLAPTLDGSQTGTGTFATTTQSSKKVAKDICKKFKNGVSLTFSPKVNPGALQRAKPGEGKFDLEVTVEPNVMGGDLYKILKFPNVKHLNFYSSSMTVKTLDLAQRYGDQGIIKHHPNAKEHVNSYKAITGDEFADNFPTMNERSEASNMDADADELGPKVIMMKNPSQVEKDSNSMNQGGKDPNKSGTTISLGQVKDQLLQQRPSKKYDNENASSSLKTSSHREIRVAKALDDLFDRRTMRPVTKVTIFIVYLAMIVVLALASLEYFFSNKSFTEMQDGAMIINHASNRLLNYMIMWEYLLIIYSRAVAIRPIGTGIASFQNTVLTRTLNLIEEDGILQNRLQDSGNMDLINNFFSKNFSLWLPYQSVSFSGEPVDTFIASTVMENKGFKVAYWTESPLLLDNDDDIVFAINNTCNQVLMNSEGQISVAADIMSNIIATNQTLVAVLLGLEIFAISSVVLFLLLVIRVILQSYSKLFRVLSRIKEDVFLQRVDELNAIKECFTKNVEAKDFSQKVTSYLENDHKQMKRGAKIGNKDKAKVNTGSSRHREDKFILKDLAKKALKNLFLACILVATIAGGFFAAYFTASTTFTDLEVKNNRLSIAHKLGYSFDQLLGAFYFTVIFYNSTEFTFRYGPPVEQFNVFLDYISTANELLLDSLTDANTGDIDPILQDFLRADMCSYVSDTVLANCLTTAQKYGAGLLSMNTQYVQFNTLYYQKFLQTPTFVAAQTLLVDYAVAITSMVSVFPEAYEFLRSYLVDDFNNKIDSQKSESLTIFIILLIALALSTGIIQIITIAKLKDIDIGIRKILKLIPFTMIQENRLLGFYLKNEFKKELDDIKQFV